MSIEKLDFQQITKDHLPFTTFLNRVIQNIQYGEALAVWVYLCTLPPGWKINKTQLQNHFSYGEKKIKYILSYLSKSNLLEYRQEKNSNGTWQPSAIHILSGSKFIKIDSPEAGRAESAVTGGAEIATAVASVDNFPEKSIKSMVEPVGQKTGVAVNGSYRKDGHINTTMLIKEKKEIKEIPRSLSFSENQKPKDKPDYVPDWKKNEPRSNVQYYQPKPDVIKSSPQTAKHWINQAMNSLKPKVATG